MRQKGPQGMRHNGSRGPGAGVYSNAVREKREAACGVRRAECLAAFGGISATEKRFSPLVPST